MAVGTVKARYFKHMIRCWDRANPLILASFDWDAMDYLSHGVITEGFLFYFNALENLNRLFPVLGE